MTHDVVARMQRMRVEDNSAARPQGDANANRSKRYSSQRQRMTTPPPPPSSGGPGVVVSGAPYVGNVNSAYYGPYGDGAPPSYPNAASTYPKTVAAAPMQLPLVTAQGAPPPSFIPTPLGFPAAGSPASYTAGYAGYPAAAAPAVPVGVPIASPTQDLYHAGGIMYYDTGRQVS